MLPGDHTPKSANMLVTGITLTVLLIVGNAYLFFGNIGTVRVAVTEQVARFEQARDTVEPSKRSHRRKMQALAEELRDCWHLRGQRYDRSLITLTLEFNPDHSLQDIRVADGQRAQYENDPEFRKITDSAIAALPSCPVFATFPDDEYQRWKKIDLTFDARSTTPR